MPNILVVGAGSIGKRHINNLLALGAEVAVYRYRQAALAAQDPLPARATVVADLQSALVEPYDAVVVANRTDQHLAVALAAARAGKALLIEKPLSNTLSGVDELVAITRERELTVEIGLMLRVHPNLVWLRDQLAAGRIGEILYVRAAVGHHLAAWRPGTDHRVGYSGRRDWGGGVIFDLIHELDLVRWLCGEVADVSAMTAYSRSLGVETEVIAQIGLQMQTGVLAQVHLDCVRASYSRTFEIAGSEGMLVWDYVAGTIVESRDTGAPRLVHQVPAGFDRNTMFVAHMRLFLSRLADRSVPAASSLDDGVAALRLALACHRSAEERRRVAPSDVATDFAPTGICA